MRAGRADVEAEGGAPRLDAAHLVDPLLEGDALEEDHRELAVREAHLVPHAEGLALELVVHARRAVDGEDGVLAAGLVELLVDG